MWNLKLVFWTPRANLHGFLLLSSGQCLKNTLPSVGALLSFWTPLSAPHPQCSGLFAGLGWKGLSPMKYILSCLASFINWPWSILPLT